jgi:hypothetical protein
MSLSANSMSLKSVYVAAAILMAIIAGMAFCPAAAWAQQAGTAGIYGTVLDPQGATIPGAQVTLTHVERNQTRTTGTNSEGNYVFPLLAPGNYQVRVEHPGFKTFQQTGIVLEVNDNRKIEVAMQIGDISTHVQVEAAAATVETSSATIKNVVEGRRITELPLNGRNVLELGLLVPGAVSTGSAVTGGAKSPADNQQFSINGSRQDTTKFTLDGGDNQDNLTNVNAPYPFPDAVEEISVQTSNMTADVGKSSSGAINVVTKGGTNEFHGSGFWFVRNYDMNAGSFFLHQSDNLKRNQAGFTFGGPIIKDKLFFFGGIQRSWYRWNSTEAKTLTMPAAHRTGDFSDLLRLSKPITLLDPTNSQPFTGNIIPTSRFSPAAAALLKLSPVGGADGWTRWTNQQTEDPREYIMRGDWRPNNKHNVIARYLQNTDPFFVTFDPTNIHSVNQNQSSYSKNATLGYTLILSPSLIVDSHVTMSRTVGTRGYDFPYTMKSFGVNVYPTSNQISVGWSGTAGTSAPSTPNPPATFARTNIEYTHAWRWIKGRHNMVAGLDVMFSRYNEYNTFHGSGVYSFNGRYSGYEEADYLLGLMSAFDQSNGENESRRYHYQGFYVNDAMRISRRLTLNYGLRWEPYTPITDVLDRQVQFRLDAYQQKVKSQRYLNAPRGLLYPGDTVSGYTIPKSGVEAAKKQFAPRIGLAWDVNGDGRTSVRIGYGIFFDAPMLYALNNMNLQTPFSFTVAFQDGYFDDPYRGRQNLNLFPASGDFDKNTPFQIPTSAVVYRPVIKMPNVQNGNVSLERSLGSWTFQGSYVVAKATHLVGDIQINAPTYNYNLDPDPAKNLSLNRANVNIRRPLQEFSGMTAVMTELNSFYNGLQTAARKRFSRGFSVQTSYTFSKNIDYRSTNKEASTGGVQNPYNWRMMRGPSDYDRTHVFVGSFVWNVPRLAKAINQPVLGWITDNWQLSGIQTFYSGAPTSFNATNDAMASAGTAQAVIVGDLYLSPDRSRNDQMAKYFNTAAVAQAAPGTWGAAGRGILRLPGGSGSDASLSKTFPMSAVRESMSATFRAEAFKVFNHPQLAGPNTSLGNANFGKITTVGGTRVLQLGLKIAF